jgi:hypothetical protein
LPGRLLSCLYQGRGLRAEGKKRDENSEP